MHSRITLGVAFTLAMLSTAAVAQTAEDQQACMDDAFRVCSATIPDRARTTACMVANKARLSPACQTVMDKYATQTTQVATTVPATPVRATQVRTAHSSRPGKPLNILPR